MNLANTLPISQALPASALPNVMSEKQTEETALLVQMIKSKSERGFTILYDHYSTALYHSLIKIVKTKELAEDLLQDTFVKIWKNIDHYDHKKGTLYTWMLNIAKNQAIDYLRSATGKQQSRYESVDLFMLYRDYACDNTSMNYELAYKDFITNCKQIDSKYAEVIDMIFFYGFTQCQTAQILQLPLGTVKTRARKGLSMLKVIYEKQ